MPFPELDKLIVDHLADIDSAAKRLMIVQTNVFSALGAVAEDWAEKNGWSGKYDYLDSGLWLAPPDWRTAGTQKDDDAFDAWFEMELGAGDTAGWKPEEDYFYLTRLCRLGVGQIGLRFKQEVTTKVIWKKSLKNLTSLVLETPFVVDVEPSFFLPFRLNSSELANALHDQVIETAMVPFAETLAQLAAAKPAFDEIIAAIRPVGG